MKKKAKKNPLAKRVVALEKMIKTLWSICPLSQQSIRCCMHYNRQDIIDNENVVIMKVHSCRETVRQDKTTIWRRMTGQIPRQWSYFTIEAIDLTGQKWVGTTSPSPTKWNMGPAGVFELNRADCFLEEEDPVTNRPRSGFVPRGG